MIYNIQTLKSTPSAPSYREFYVNRYLTGSLLSLLCSNLFTSVGVLFYLPLLVGLSMVAAMALTGWLLGWPSANAVTSGPILSWPLRAQAGLALVCLAGLGGAALGLAIMMRSWAVFFRIVRSRSDLSERSALAFIEGYPVFSGGRPPGGKSPGHPPDKLTVGGITFDLDHCRKTEELLRVRSEPFVGAEPSPQGWSYGFSLRVPLQVCYVPSTRVLFQVATLQRPDAQVAGRADLLRSKLLAWRQGRSANLSRADVAKTMALLRELEALGMALSRGASESERGAAEARLAEIEEWLGALGIQVS